MKQRTRLVLQFGTLCLILVSFLSTPSFNLYQRVQAEDCDGMATTDKIKCLQGKINEKQAQASTLASTISVINGKILVEQLQINQTKSEINQLEKDIQDLSERISGLNTSLDSMTDILIQRVVTNYKRHQSNPLELLLVSDTIDSFFTKYKYLQIAQEHTSELMAKAENQKTSFDQEKTLKEQKQDELDKKKTLLVQQQSELDQQKKEQTNLLSQTKNDEARYQQLLTQAQAEISSFKAFSTSLGIGILPEQHSPDGWYFSQRDQRWANACIGNSCGTRNEGNILEVGCLISSTAMIKKKFGEDVTPLSIARNSSYFFSNTAYMVRPWPAPGGYSYVQSGLNQDKVDSELKADRPVIFHLRVNSRDGHFIVIKAGEHGDYTMHDPAQGYDKKFTDFYRFSQVDSMAYLVKN